MAFSKCLISTALRSQKLQLTVKFWLSADGGLQGQSGEQLAAHDLPHRIGLANRVSAGAKIIAPEYSKRLTSYISRRAITILANKYIDSFVLLG